MLVAWCGNQLGNQMFAYASVKSICLDNNYEFKLFKEPIHIENANNFNSNYGKDIWTIFDIPNDEILEKIPDNLDKYIEPPLIRNKSNYHESAVNVKDNTFMEGLFIHSKYFEKHLNDMRRKWFVFPDDIDQQVNQEMCSIRDRFPGKKIVSVHFRVGQDFVRSGYLLEKSYWDKAARYFEEREVIDNVVFLLFYDKKSKWISKFMKEHCAIDVRKDLIHDMCMITKCDGCIVCNSTYSIMAAYLNPVQDIICPSIWPLPDGKGGGAYAPEDCYDMAWNRIEARRSNRSLIYYKIFFFYKKNILPLRSKLERILKRVPFLSNLIPKKLKKKWQLYGEKVNM